MRYVIALCALMALLSACNTFEAGIAGTPTSAAQSVDTAIPTSTTDDHTAIPAAATATPTTARSPTTAVRMDETPPAGLVYRTDAGLWRTDGSGEPTQISDRPQAQLSPDGRYVLFPTAIDSPDSTLQLTNVDTGQQRNLIADEDRLSCCASLWPARSDWVIVNSWSRGTERGMGGDIVVGFLTAVELESGEHRLLDPERDVGSIHAPSPDGQYVAYGGGRVGWLYNWNDDRIGVFDPAVYALPDEFEPTQVHSPAWSPDGTKLAWYVHGRQDDANRTAIGIFDLESGDATLLHPFTMLGSDAPTPAPRFSPDGEWVAFYARDGNMDRNGTWIARVDGSKEIPLAVEAPLEAPPPAWHPDGEHIVYSRVDERDGTASTWLLQLETGERQALDMPVSDAVVVDWRRPG